MLFLVHNRGVSERERERRRSENADKIRLVHRASIPNCFFSSASNTQCSDNFFHFFFFFIVFTVGIPRCILNNEREILLSNFLSLTAVPCTWLDGEARKIIFRRSKFSFHVSSEFRYSINIHIESAPTQIKLLSSDGLRFRLSVLFFPPPTHFFIHWTINPNTIILFLSFYFHAAGLTFS